MNKSEMHSQLTAISGDIRKAMMSKTTAMLLLPKIFDELLGLLTSIINALPEDPHGKA